MDILWADFKAFVTARSLSIQYVTYNNNYHLRAADGFFELGCIIPSDRNLSSDTVDFEDNFKANGNKANLDKAIITSQPDPAPFAQPTFRTKRAKTSSVTSINANSSQTIDYLITADRYFFGGSIIIENAEFGDYFTAEVYDADSVIPSPYRSALCEAWPTVAVYVEGEFVEAQNPGTVTSGGVSIHHIDGRPLSAKVTAGLYMRITYYAVNSGLTRRVAMNYGAVKKL